MAAKLDSILLTVSELRARIGGALADTRLAGYILDADLQAILDEERGRLVGMATNIAREALLSGKSLLVGTGVSRPVVASGHWSGTYEATIPEQYFPFVFRADTAEGDAITYDDQLLRLRYSSVPRRRYFVTERTAVFLLPDSPAPEAVSVALATEEAVLDSLVSEDVAQSNERAVAKATAMLKARIAEQTRQEMDEPPED